MATSNSIDFKVKGQQGSIPAIGLGTVGLFDETCVESCKSAFTAGYRMLDTALSYGNHASVAEAIRVAGIPREDVFVTAKVAFSPKLRVNQSNSTIWLYDPKNAKGNEHLSIELCLQQLGLDYVDLLLVHSPCTSLEEHGSSCLPHFFELFNHQNDPSAIRPDILPDGSRMRDVLTWAKRAELIRTCDKDLALETRKQTWAAIERALKDGKCRYIGVSNYPAVLLKEMETYAEIMPAVNQVELHPWFARSQLQETARELGVALIAYGSGQALQIRQTDTDSVETVKKIADKTGKTPLQVILRWNFQRGIVSIPRSKSSDHIKENADIFSWELSVKDMAQLDALDEDYPFYWDPQPIVAIVSCHR